MNFVWAKGYSDSQVSTNKLRVNRLWVNELALACTAVIAVHDDECDSKLALPHASDLQQQGMHSSCSSA